MGAPAFDGSQVGPPVGYYTYTVGDDHWWWSDGMYVLHGFAPREVPATTEFLLHHKHPDDIARTYEVLETAVRTGEPFSCYHRVIDRRGRVRSVLAVGRGVKDADGHVEQLTGFFIDLTEVRRAETEAEVELALLRIAEHRATIEQAKGMLMVVTGCDAEGAFALLRHYSQQGNVKLNEVAHRLVATVASARSSGEATGATVMSFLEGLRSPV
jgi:PAS domain S-box-containing protein